MFISLAVAQKNSRKISIFSNATLLHFRTFSSGSLDVHTRILTANLKIQNNKSIKLQHDWTALL